MVSWQVRGHSLKVIKHQVLVFAGKRSRDLFIAHQAKGAGYAISTPEELQTALAVSEATGTSMFICPYAMLLV